MTSESDQSSLSATARPFIPLSQASAVVGAPTAYSAGARPVAEAAAGSRWISTSPLAAPVAAAHPPPSDGSVAGWPKMLGKVSVLQALHAQPQDPREQYPLWHVEHHNRSQESQRKQLQLMLAQQPQQQQQQQQHQHQQQHQQHQHQQQQRHALGARHNSVLAVGHRALHAGQLSAPGAVRPPDPTVTFASAQCPSGPRPREQSLSAAMPARDAVVLALGKQLLGVDAGRFAAAATSAPSLHFAPALWPIAAEPDSRRGQQRAGEPARQQEGRSQAPPTRAAHYTEGLSPRKPYFSSF